MLFRSWAGYLALTLTSTTCLEEPFTLPSLICCVFILDPQSLQFCASWSSSPERAWRTRGRSYWKLSERWASAAPDCSCHQPFNQSFDLTASRTYTDGRSSLLQNNDVTVLSSPAEAFYPTCLCLPCSSETFIWSCTGTFRAGVSFLLSLNLFMCCFLSKLEY